MVFSSFFYLLVFLPLSWLGSSLAIKLGHLLSAERATRSNTLPFVWLLACSSVFFAWQHIPHLALLLASILFNFGWGRLLAWEPLRASSRRRRRLVLATGIGANLGLIGYFKYTRLLEETLVAWGWDAPTWQILLPIGISFFTFQQIAYLVDVHQDGQACDHLIDFALFVSFFPQLIAGPIVHHREMLPQLRQRLGRGIVRQKTKRGDDSRGSPNQVANRLTPRSINIAVGLTMLAMGLFKKVVLADQFAVFANPVFAAAERGAELSLATAWLGALSWTLQLYFDFSGYSDMAVGAARLFGIRLPVNFHSPYQSTSIIEFWRRWHITLSRFLKDYLYIPLGGGRNGTMRRYVNLMITMLLGGLWHGASWTFVAWGSYHGILLCLNHGWRKLSRIAVGAEKGAGIAASTSRSNKSLLWMSGFRVGSVLLTFVAVIFGWVLFRAETFQGAGRLISAMLGLEAVGLEAVGSEGPSELNRRLAGVWVLFGLLIVWGLPNSHQLLRRYRPVLFAAGSRFCGPASGGRTPVLLSWRQRLEWRPNAIWLLWVLGLLLCSLMLLDRPSEFIYYRF